MRYWVVILVLISLMSCWIFGDKIDLGNGWVAGTDGVGKSWLTKEKYIPEQDTTIIIGIKSSSAGFDFDDEFIVAAQGQGHWIDSVNRVYEAYWVIEKQTDVVYGPMSMDSFWVLRNELGVPSELKVRSPYEW